MIEKKTTNKFMFYENFLNAIDTLPEDKKYQICYEFCRYGITGELPKNEVSKMLCIAVSASVQKYQGRGGAREGAGRPKKQENQIDGNIQKNQKNQKIQKQQTETININKNININDNLFGGLDNVTAPREQQAVLPPQNSAEKKKPTKEMVIDYARQRDRIDLVDKFFDYYSAGNWVGVKNWKQKFITWEMHNEKPKGNIVKTDNELRAKL